MKRRMLLGGLGFTGLTASGAFAQTPQRVARVAFLSRAASESRPAYLAFRMRLRELGWIEGQNFELKFHLGDGTGEQSLESRARAIATSGVDVVLADAGEATRAMAAASRTIPIVAIMGVDPTESGLATSLARPGGNVTGLTLLFEPLSAKRLEFLRDVLPAAKRIAIIHNARNREADIKGVVHTSAEHGFDARRIVIDALLDIPRLLSVEALAEIDVALVIGTPFLDVAPGLIVGPLNAARKPAIYPDRSYVEIGGMMSYGFDYTEMFRRLAGYVNRVLRGESPAVIPFEQPERFQLVLNMRTLRLLGLSVPPIILARADEVLE